MATITAANSKFTLAAGSVFPVPVAIQGYSADDAFATEEVDMAENQVGVDGELSSGYTPYAVPLEFTLQANSPSIAVMDAIITAERVLKDKIELRASIQIPSIGKIFVFSKGYLSKGPVMPSAGKVLKPQKYTLTFKRCIPAPVSA